jgi:hypothetical protein
LVLRSFGFPAKYFSAFVGLLFCCRILVLPVFLARYVFTCKVLYFFELRGFCLRLLLFEILANGFYFFGFPSTIGLLAVGLGVWGRA